MSGAVILHVLFSAPHLVHTLADRKDILEPGYVPANCDVEALTRKSIQLGTKFASETPHFDSVAGQCDCARHTNRTVCKGSPADQVSPKFTVVTALVDIGRQGRNPCDYLQMFAVHLRRNVSMVVFTEAWAAPFVNAVRDDMGLRHKTSVRVLTKQSKLYFYQFIPKMQAAADQRRVLEWVTGTATTARVNALYAWINHQKYEWLAQISEQNPFRTDYFVWIDSGAGHGHILVPQNFCACNIAHRDTVTVFSTTDNFDALVLNNTDGSLAVGAHKLPAPAPSYSDYHIGPRSPILRRFLPKRHRAKTPLEKLSLQFYKRSAWHRDNFDEIIMGTFWGAWRLLISRSKLH